MKRKIAYTRLTRWPAPNTIVGETLQQVYPEYEVDVFDLATAIKRDRKLVATNLLHTFRMYGADIVRRKRTLRTCFFRTPYIFNALRHMVLRRFAGGDYVFGFQIQSIFDASLPGVPHFLYTDHTHLANLSYPGFSASKLYNPAWIELERGVYRATTINFTRSTNIARSLVEQYGCPPERVACVYAGSNVAVGEQPLQNDGYRNKHILYVGMDWQRKGGPDLLAAFEQVLRAHPDAKLTIVGASPQIALPNVDVVGRVPLAEVPRYYRDASVFCLPTKLEPFGIVFIEALNYRLPIVGTNIGAVPDFVLDGENGYLIEPGDRDALASRLGALLDSPELCREFGERGYALAQDRYTWPRVGERLREHIDRSRGARG